MNPKKCKELLDTGVLQAFAEGRVIEFSVDCKTWQSCGDLAFLNSAYYRIKPEPKYRPFNNIEAIKLVGSFLFRKKDGKLFCIDGVFIQEKSFSFVLDSSDCYGPSFLLNHYTFKDGSPCGVIDETNM